VKKDVGLFIALYDILEQGDQYLYPLDGSAHVHVKFRYVVFRPFVGETISGKVLQNGKDGLQVSLGFFDDIFIPSHFMRDNVFFEEETQTWYFLADGEHKMYYDVGHPIRFKVVSETFKDVHPTTDDDNAARATTATLDNKPGAEEDAEVGGFDTTKIAYFLTASVKDDGLGMEAWW
ncbi:hypothetical protein SARC_12956, partial [Sphaeroforma arctica JP610]